MSLNSEEYFAISRELEKHHVLFYTVWDLGVPIFTEEISTAAVRFNSEGDCIEFLFNQNYWNALNEYQRKFVICHECLHVILNHGLRIRNMFDANKDAINASLDIVVNHLLVNRFGFERDKIYQQEKLCWTDTVFPQQPVPNDGCFEYYYNLLPKISVLFNKDGSRSKELGFPDDHSGLEGSDWNQLIEKLSDKITDEEKTTIKDLIEKHSEDETAGSSTTGSWQFANVGVVVKKKKWESVIKKWSKKFDRPEFHETEQWARINRRFMFLNNDLLLPSDMEQEYELEGKIDVWFFQDTSSSCASYRDRFFKAAMTLNPSRFNVILHCFDTQVYETTIESKKLYGFGGTAFHPIEMYIQQKITKENKKYPEAIFVITDGYGTKVNPQKPKNWYWFTTTNYKICIPKESLVFELKDFE
jgi:hypothetical protein